MATWTDGAGGDIAVTDFIRGVHFREITTPINRRRLLTYQFEEDFSTAFQDDSWISRAPISTDTPPPFYNLRDNIDTKIINAPNGGLGGTPSTPTEMSWLWPIADGDENDVIVTGSPGAGEVNFFAKMNGGSDWTDPTLDNTKWIRTVHLNELRWAMDVALLRGKWELPVYFSAGLFSPLPDTPWAGGGIANNGVDELRCLGTPIIYVLSEDRGLKEVTIRSSSRLYLQAPDSNVEVDVFRCKRPVNYSTNTPTWNEYNPDDELAWQVAGCGGANDRAVIGSLSLVAGVWNSLTGAVLASEVQAMIDGVSDDHNFMIRRSDIGDYTIDVIGKLHIEFDIDVPPN